MEKLTDIQRQVLRSPLPPEALNPHPTKPYLTTIKAIYVVERLNDVFDIGGWYIKNEIVSAGEKWIIMKATLTVPQYGIEIEQFGGNDNADPGDAYKGACTDALTKIGSYLEIGIDVFKGIKTHNAPQTTQTSYQRPPMTSQAPSNEKKVGDVCPDCGGTYVKWTSGNIGCGNKCFVAANAHLKTAYANSKVSLEDFGIKDKTVAEIFPN